MTLTVRLKPELERALELHCAERGVTKSLVVKGVLAEYLATQDRTAPRAKRCPFRRRRPDHLARWLADEHQHPSRNLARDVLPAHLRAFTLACVNYLLHDKGVPPQALLRHQYPLEQRLALRIARWVRNLDSEPVHAFWLPTSAGRLYPDFVCELTEGRVFVAEYKGEHLRTAPKEIEKGQVGRLWAERSGAKAVFAMLFKLERGMRVSQQIDAAQRTAIEYPHHRPSGLGQNPSRNGAWSRWRRSG